MRGEHCIPSARRLVDRGIIPACAGSTCPGSSRRSLEGDHPRMRGEHFLHVEDSAASKGSSPHARGALALFALLAVAPGIIPACAGSTLLRKRNRLLNRDHPRMRGEHAGVAMLHQLQRGSSPHARGARHDRSDDDLLRGIIPACAGSTRHGPELVFRPRDHPRMRGEHVTVTAHRMVLQGSSPHARGAHCVRIDPLGA